MYYFHRLKLRGNDMNKFIMLILLVAFAGATNSISKEYSLAKIKNITQKEISLLTNGDVEKMSKVKQRALYQRTCDLGAGEVCYELAIMYRDGTDLVDKKDATKSGKLCKKACDRDMYMGCFGLGIMYKYGKGVKKSKINAKYFFNKACDGGVKEGCQDLNY